jgi:hypothetical protein
MSPTFWAACSEGAFSSGSNSFRRQRLWGEHVAAVDPGRRGNSMGYLSFEEKHRVGAAVRIALGL